jgi:tRNA (cmo5U34)-methyltransferase
LIAKIEEYDMKKVGDGLAAGNASWNFKGEVAQGFDAHVSKSVPLYYEGHQLIANLSDFFIKNDSVCYEIGCSTGELTLTLAKHNESKSGARFIGIDVEADMIKLATQKKTQAQTENVNFEVDDALQYEFESADLIVAYYTVQFIRPSKRQVLIDNIYKKLNWGGAFILFEKVRANDARFQDIMTSLYNDYKLNQGYSPEEIFAKSVSLKGVLEPFSTQANTDMMKRAGFVDITSVMKYVSFEGFLAIK